MQRIPGSLARRMPWKNGGGSTLELARYPAEGDFGWRVSIADVEASGPFSRFDGYDRHILLLQGQGMHLVAGPHGTLPLTTPYLPQSFPGEWDVEGQLVEGPVRDFNLMTKRGSHEGQLESFLLQAPHTFTCPPSGWLLAHVVEGGLQEAEIGDTLLARADIALTPLQPTRLVLALISG
jgi:environmental stress-induced protein Ves